MAVEQTPKTDDAARAKARERMAAYRKTPEYQDWLQRSRELRRGLKEKYRRQAGAKPRDAQAAAEKREQEAAARRLRDEVRGLHDAHVKQFRRVMASRRKAAKRYVNNPDGECARSAARKRVRSASGRARRAAAMGCGTSGPKGTACSEGYLARNWP